MPGSGRNQPCPCGSGRKTKHCCGEHRGPSDEQLARAHVAELCHQTIHELDSLSDRSLDHLAEELFDLPALDLSLLVTLPKLIGPDLERLCEAIEHDDPEWGSDALTNVHKQIDTPQQRARLADAVIRLRDQHRIATASRVRGAEPSQQKQPIHRSLPAQAVAFTPRQTTPGAQDRRLTRPFIRASR